MTQHAPGIAPKGAVLDLAAGSGRHAYYLAGRGHNVLALDRDVSSLSTAPGVEILAADLEDGSLWPLPGRQFDGIVVTNYLHRPLFPRIVASLASGGLLIYETFAEGNAAFGKPSNPGFLLAAGELLGVAETHGLTVLGYFHGYSAQPKPAMVQRLAARRST